MPYLRAFSLVELSIVLVILGLLTGGILAGQSLIRASELRSVSADLQRLHSAVYTFRDKYMAVPGDMPNATRFWGIRAGTGSDLTCHQTIGSTTGTCNGNGDGAADFIPGDGAMFGERFLAMQHLARAGLLKEVTLAQALLQVRTRA
jgi:prepilin-type N-terminal cleavage/methylation domain-containing protein